MAVALEDHVRELLRRDPHRSLSVQQLHGLLIHEVGHSAGTYHDLHTRLKQAGAKFMVVDRVSPLGGESGWTHEVREAYSGALNRVGADFSPIVSLSPETGGQDSSEDVVDALRATLLTLSVELEDPRVREDILETLLSVTAPAGREAGARTTTPPPGPLPGG